MTKRPPGVGKHTEEMQLPCITAKEAKEAKEAKLYTSYFLSLTGNTLPDLSG